VASHGEVSYFYYRYLLFTLPAWAVLAGAGLTMAPRRLAAVLLAALALLTLPDQAGMRAPFAHFWQGADARGAAALIAAGHRPGDGVVYERGDHAWRQFDLAIPFNLPRGLQLRDVFLATSGAERHELQSTECAAPARCLGSEKRLWLVVADAPDDPLTGLDPAQDQALRRRYTVTSMTRLTGLTVALLE
ncbi:MAG: hypothetical protein LBV78_09460, partial [Kitasatospora sp.]|jgi:mannosyltransferase|nr:hypothetical protein [Kitasatospora sp.]